MYIVIKPRVLKLEQQQNALISLQSELAPVKVTREKEATCDACEHNTYRALSTQHSAPNTQHSFGVSRHSNTRARDSNRDANADAEYEYVRNALTLNL